MKTKDKVLRALAVAGLLPLAACGDFLEVTNPGPIEDVALNVPEAVPGLVAGMSGDLSVRYDDLVIITGLASDELAHGGSYTAEGLFYRGVLRPEDVNFYWAGIHRARWAAEQGIERMKTIPGYQYGKDVHSARANLLAGFANRALGENMCQTVIDGELKGDNKLHFPRAEGYFTEALRIAQTLAGAEAKSVATAALGGRASVRAWQGNWKGATEDAAQVPSAFRYDARFHGATSRENNDLVYETHTRREFTVFNTPWARVRDARVPWDTVKLSSGKVQSGQDGRTPFFRQKKYTDLGSEIPLTKGTEMRMLQAEAALREGKITEAIGLINDQRRANGLAAVSAPATLDAAWDLLQTERGATLWLEARRLWDLRRWLAEKGPAHNSFLASRPEGRCIPVSQVEQESTKG